MHLAAYPLVNSCQGFRTEASCRSAAAALGLSSVPTESPRKAVCVRSDRVFFCAILPDLAFTRLNCPRDTQDPEFQSLFRASEQPFRCVQGKGEARSKASTQFDHFRFFITFSSFGRSSKFPGGLCLPDSPTVRFFWRWWRLRRPLIKKVSWGVLDPACPKALTTSEKDQKYLMTETGVVSITKMDDTQPGDPGTIEKTRR